MSTIQFPEKFKGLFEPYRFKIFYGGRGGAKTTQFAIALILLSLQETCTILACREYQTSIGKSVHAVLKQEIVRLGLQEYFTITEDKIVSHTGTQFIFAGIANNIDNIKSIPNIKYCWVEEANSVSQRSWDVLIPTIRAANSEIWVSFNPYLDTEPAWKEFVLKQRPNSLVVKVGWQDNPWFPKELLEELVHLKETDYEKYLNVWEGEPLSLSDAIIYKGKFFVEEFTAPEKADFLHGMDFGYSADPMAMIRCFVQDAILYIDYEAYAHGVELDEYGPYIESIPTGKRWKWYADSANPDNINLIRRQGYSIEAVNKSKNTNSVEGGISHIRAYRKIIVHPRCKNTINELSKYCWKTDKISGDIQPVPKSGNDHAMDALRYALSKYISKGTMTLEKWRKFNA